MEGSPIDIILFAPLAPIFGVLLFWFMQLLFIESQKYFLEKIRSKHEPFCRFTNFLGILFQSICHGLGYTVTKSGISDFYISVSYGRVAPKKEKKGIFEWVANAFLFIGPFFIPAFLLLLCLLVLIPDGFATPISSNILEFQYTFSGQLSLFGINLYNFSANFFEFLLSIDLAHPGHLGFLLLLIFLGLGIRPSHIGEKKIDKVDMIYDLRNIWKLISHKPLYVLMLFLLSYIFFYASLLFNQSFYTILFSVFGWLSIISIVAIFISHIIILFVYMTDKIEGWKRILCYLILPISYIVARILFFVFPIINYKLILNVSFLMMILSTIIVTFLLLKSQDDKFKTRRKIKWFKGNKEIEENKNER
jgi:hypothetical protein